MFSSKSRDSYLRLLDELRYFLTIYSGFGMNEGTNVFKFIHFWLFRNKKDPRQRIPIEDPKDPSINNDPSASPRRFNLSLHLRLFTYLLVNVRIFLILVFIWISFVLSSYLLMVESSESSGIEVSYSFSSRLCIRSWIVLGVIIRHFINLRLLYLNLCP